MKGYWFFPLGICLAGCMVSSGLQYEAMSETNIYHIAKIRKGMSEKQVLQVMHKPYSYESFEVADDVYDVWFYVTRVNGLDQTRMVPQNLTPLTFKNGVLVGTGYYWYYYAMKEQAGELASQKPEVEKAKTQEAEDMEFEKALKAKPGKQAPAPSDSNQIQKALNPSKQEKLPPNVRIVSNEEVVSCPCPEKLCGPNRFSVLSKGMSETQVVNIVGDPVKYETFEMDYDVYDVWFYETVASKSKKPSIVPQNMTPLTFKNAVLISMSDEEFFALKQRAIVATSKAASVAEPQVPLVKRTLFKPYVPKTPLGVTDKVFSKVRKGMTEDEVMDLLGSTVDQESLSVGSDVYDIWFYEVGTAKKSHKVPLTFKNGKLVGTTAKEYDNVKGQADPDQVNGYDRKDDRMQEDESEQNFNYW